MIQLKTSFPLKKKIIFKKLELIYKIYIFIMKRYWDSKPIYNRNLIVFKSLIIRQKCIISNRQRGSYKVCSLSRFKIKEFLSVGFIPNLKKLSW